MDRSKFVWRVSKFLAGIIFVYALFYTFKNFLLQSSVLRYKMLSEYLETNDVHSTKYIAFWTKYFDGRWGMHSETFNEEFLESISCPSTNCVFTHNKNLLERPHEYHAIIFHGAEPWINVDLPKTRLPNQLYIMATQEPPGEVKRNLDSDNEFYNLTMNYRLDSDIQWFIGVTTDLETGKRVAPAVNVQWREPDEDFSDKEILQIVENKQKTAAWFVSHCNAFSKRDGLVEKLQKFIDVDVYGKCGTLSCPRYSKECDEMLNTTYRFYFAFENSLCIDYLSEKVYDTINHNIVPVIYTGADLKRFLPPKSYIDANEFGTAEDLADYLKFLSTNPEEYLKYFWWKKHYKITSYHKIELCDICQKLNQPNFTSKRQTYVSIKDWVYRNTCRDPKIKF